MSPEQQREQLLKRILPALAICVIYFVFISGIIQDKAEKAEQNYIGLFSKGISVSSLPGLQSQSAQTRSEIRRLQDKIDNYRQQLKGMAGFLSRDNADNKAAAVLSTILAENQIQVIEEKREPYAIENLPRSIRELKSWLQDDNQETTETIEIQRLSVLASYPDMYQAMLQLAKSKFPAIPVSLTMEYAPDEVRRNDADQKWQLILWM